MIFCTDCGKHFEDEYKRVYVVCDECNTNRHRNKQLQDFKTEKLEAEKYVAKQRFDAIKKILGIELEYTVAIASKISEYIDEQVDETPFF